MFSNILYIFIRQLTASLGKVSDSGKTLLQEPCLIDKDLVGTGDTSKTGTPDGINIIDNRSQERFLVQNNASPRAEVRVE